jgi:hypothetical protein
MDTDEKKYSSSIHVEIPGVQQAVCFENLSVDETNQLEKKCTSRPQIPGLLQIMYTNCLS